jgi:transcription initiation factor IIA gamma subunit
VLRGTHVLWPLAVVVHACKLSWLTPGHLAPPSLQGSLSTYRFCDEVWTFLIKNVQFKLDNGGQIVQADKVKIVSCNAKKPGEGP